MKKVLVLVAAALLFTTPAMALIAGGSHDLSSAGGGPVTSNTDETCVFCHTPHGAAAVGFAPLWNRGVVNATDFYNNPAGSMQAVVSLANTNATDAPLCLSCHDGSSFSGALVNPPNALGGPSPTTVGAMGAFANLDTDLSNDHPIGFDYVAAQGLDAELRTKVVAEGVLGAGALSYGAGDDMWCSSCHDVHGVAAVPTFLRVANTASALCTACHIK